MPGNTVNIGRLTKASSDPSVVMPDSSTTDVLPPYQVKTSKRNFNFKIERKRAFLQPSYDTRYGFNNQDQQPLPPDNQLTPTDSPLVKEAPYALSNPDISSGIDPQNPYGKVPSYNDKAPMYPADAYQKPDYPKMMDSRHDIYNSPDRK